MAAYHEQSHPQDSADTSSLTFSQRLAKRFGHPVPSPTKSIQDTKPTSAHAKPYIHTMSRREMLGTVGAATIAIASIPITAGIADYMGYGSAAEARKASEEPDAIYLPIFEQVIVDAFGNKFGPVMPANPNKIAYPDLPAFIEAKQPDTHVPPQLTWQLPFNQIGNEITTRPIPIVVALDFDHEISPEAHSPETLKRVTIKGNVTPLFLSLESHDDRIRAIQALVDKSDEDDMVIIPRGSGTTDRNSTPETSEARRETNGKLIVRTRISEHGNFLYDRSYNN